MSVAGLAQAIAADAKIALGAVDEHGAVDLGSAQDAGTALGRIIANADAIERHVKDIADALRSEARRQWAEDLARQIGGE